MSRKSGGEVPGQEFLEPVHGMFCDAFEHVAQVEFRVESVELRRTEQGVDSSSTLATSVRAGEEVVLAAQGHGAQGAFSRGVVCALIRCIFLPGANPGRHTLAPAVNTRGGPRGDE